MADDEMAGQAKRTFMDGAQARETARMIDALMSEPIADRPAIIVLGDENVFAINPPRAG